MKLLKLVRDGLFFVLVVIPTEIAFYIASK
jgi:hypothetical protein